MCVADLLTGNEVFQQIPLQDPFFSQKDLEGIVIIKGIQCATHKYEPPKSSSTPSFIPNYVKTEVIEIKDTNITQEIKNTISSTSPGSNFSQYTFDKVCKAIKKHPRFKLFEKEVNNSKILFINLNSNTHKIENTFVVVNLQPTITAEIMFGSTEHLRDVKL